MLLLSSRQSTKSITAVPEEKKLSKKKEEAQEKEKEAKELDNAFLWFKDAPLAELIKILDEFRDKIFLTRDPKNYSGDDANAMRNCIDSFELVKSKLQLLDRKNLPDEEQSLGLYLKSFLPNCVKIFTNEIIWNSFSSRWNAKESFAVMPKGGVYYSLSYMLSDFDFSLDKQLVQGKKIPAITSLSLNLTTETSKNSELQTKLNALNELWLKAKTLNTTGAEDMYFLDEVKNSYLPESLTLYSKFDEADSEVRKVAEDILIQQLNLIHGRIESIIKGDTNRILDSMREQVAFLEAKTKKPTPSTRLSLTSTPE